MAFFAKRSDALQDSAFLLVLYRSIGLCLMNPTVATFMVFLFVAGVPILIFSSLTVYLGSQVADNIQAYNLGIAKERDIVNDIHEKLLHIDSDISEYVRADSPQEYNSMKSELVFHKSEIANNMRLLPLKESEHDNMSKLMLFGLNYSEVFALDADQFSSLKTDWSKYSNIIDSLVALPYDADFKSKAAELNAQGQTHFGRVHEATGNIVFLQDKTKYVIAENANKLPERIGDYITIAAGLSASISVLGGFALARRLFEKKLAVKQ